MLRIAVCDDEPAVARRILNWIDQYRTRHPEYDILAKGFSSSDELFAAVQGEGPYDIYVLDILMPGMNGISAAERLRGKGYRGVFIFLSVSPDYALDAYRLRGLRYLLKPSSQEEFFSALDDALNMLQGRFAKSLTISTTNGPTKIRYSSIVYVESASRVLYFHLTDGSIIQSRSVRHSFETAMAPLLEDSRFVRPHQSFLLNMLYAARMSAREFVMEDGAIVPISKKRFPMVKKQYMDFLVNTNSHIVSREDAPEGGFPCP